MPLRCRHAIGPRLEILEARLQLSALGPLGVDSAYGLNGVTFSNGTIKGNGAGQTIAIVDGYADPTIYGDLTAFDQRNGLPNPTWNGSVTAVAASNRPATLVAVNFAGTATNSGWNVEEALDVEMAHEAAPGANIVLLEAKSANPLDLLQAVQAAKTIPSVSVISMSWGGPEFYGQQAVDGDFTTPAGHVGITFLASSGDGGAGADWPASSANVVSVGGTSLMTTSTGARASESAWSGSGGAISQVVSKPTYQATAVAGKYRGVPDVSSDADPGTGVVVISQGNAMQVGGTSMAAPAWAGLIAIADQGLALSGKTSLDGATQTLPDLYKAPSGSFYDVTTGPRASVGYDTSTGLGSPNAQVLISFLDGTSIATPPTTPSGGSSSGGTVGGGKTTTANLSIAGTTAPVPAIATASSPVELGAASALIPNPVATGPSTPALLPGLADLALESWGQSGSEGFDLTTVRGARMGLGRG